MQLQVATRKGYAVTEDSATSVIQAVPFPMMVIATDRHVTACNAALDALLGRGLVGRHFITALRQPVLIEAIESAIATQRFGKGLYLHREDRKESVYQVHIAPLDGQVVLTFEDKTAVEAISQLRRDFVANVSHELRTPLTALNGFIETLRGPARDDDAARDRFLGIMERETRRMTRLVGDLLSLSRVEENERIRPQEQVVLGDLVKMTLAELAPVITEGAAQINLQDQSANAWVPGDAGQLRQVIGNLIENAVKYGVHGGEVTIEISAPAFHTGLRQEGITFAVTNGGEAIATHHIPRLTERFYRVDGHRSREVGGTGLGLAIVKHIVSRHRGRIKITSSQDDGTRVSITLPTSQQG